METIVVTASWEPQSPGDAPGTFTVISREEIESGYYTSVVDLLRRVPGVHVGQPGSRGGRASIYTRGLDPNHTLILIDGVRMNDPTNNRGGSFDLSTLDPAGIERIEISRGPISAVHGSDAIAGVINIITRTGRDAQEFTFDGRGGLWGAFRVAGEARGKVGIADLSLAGAWVDEGNPPDDQEYRGGNIKAGVGLELPAGASLRGTFRFADSESESFPDDSGGEEFAVIRSLEDRDIRGFDLHVETAQQAGRWIDYALGFDYRHRREDRNSPGIADGARPTPGVPSESSRDELDHYALSLRNTIRPVEELSLTAGGDVYWEDGSSNGQLFPGEPFAIPMSYQLDRVVGGPFAELHWRGDCGLVLYGGVRADFSDESSSEVTPRVSAQYPIPVIDLVVKGSWGEGFKLPAFFSLANPVVGNPDLVAERSRGWDLALSRGFWKSRIDGRIAYFENKVRDLIDFAIVFDPAPRPLLVNRSKVVSRGFEFELNARLLDSLDFNGNLTFTDTDIRHTGDDLLNRPRWQGAMTLAWTPVRDVTLRVSALIVGAVKDSSEPTGKVTLDPWGRVDLSASWRVREHLSLYLEIDNLFDSNYEEVVGFRAPGIRPRVGVRARF
jgi:outer membrane cobalamin receptor